MPTRIVLLLAILGLLSACGSVEVKPVDCPSGTQKLEGCPPLGAIDDPDIGKLYDSRAWQKVASLDIDPVEFGRDAKIPINHARAKFIGSTDEGGLTSLAAKIHLIEQAEHTIDVMYYIFAGDLVGLAMLGALCNAVERGVDVRIMIDSMGSISLDRNYLRALESCAVDAGFMRSEAGKLTIYKARVQPVIFNAASKIFVNHNRRSHDKLLVIDGWFPEKAAVMTGGRNISLAYYGILPDGSHNPDTYRDAEIFIRGGTSDEERRETVGTVSEIYYTLLFSFKNNKRLKMPRSQNPRDAYEDERQLFRDSLAQLQSLPRLKEYLDKMDDYVSTGFHDAQVRLAHELANLTDTNVVIDAVDNLESNPNSIMAILTSIREEHARNVQIVSPYVFAALYKDKEQNVILDDAANMLKWLDDHPDSEIEIITNSILTSDNFFTQAVIDMDLAPRLLLSEEYQAWWLQKPEKSELNPALVESDDWVKMVNHPRLHIYETGRIDDVRFGGDVDHAKLHAKYALRDDIGFVGTTNFDYRSRLYNNEMGFFFLSEELAADVRANTEYLLSVSYRWGSPEWLEMRKQLMAQSDGKASRTRNQRGLYKFLKNTGLEWFF
ncbi:MAG: phospholipase [Betaproteobacteria bacterium]|nr:MAG: phospholipase [Betaproteobacteria bacterium]